MVQIILSRSEYVSAGSQQEISELREELKEEKRRNDRSEEIESLKRHLESRTQVGMPVYRVNGLLILSFLGGSADKEVSQKNPRPKRRRREILLDGFRTSLNI